MRVASILLVALVVVAVAVVADPSKKAPQAAKKPSVPVADAAKNLVQGKLTVKKIKEAIKAGGATGDKVKKFESHFKSQVVPIARCLYKLGGLKTPENDDGDKSEEGGEKPKPEAPKPPVKQEPSAPSGGVKKPQAPAPPQKKGGAQLPSNKPASLMQVDAHAKPTFKDYINAGKAVADQAGQKPIDVAAKLLAQVCKDAKQEEGEPKITACMKVIDHVKTLFKKQHPKDNSDEQGQVQPTGLDKVVGVVVKTVKAVQIGSTLRKIVKGFRPLLDATPLEQTFEQCKEFVPAAEEPQKPASMF